MVFAQAVVIPQGSLLGRYTGTLLDSTQSHRTWNKDYLMRLDTKVRKTMLNGISDTALQPKPPEGTYRRISMAGYRIV
eukprot:scaffold2889_cov407-Prasinococcus_capsulatus_cf.AAC.13